MDIEQLDFITERVRASRLPSPARRRGIRTRAEVTLREAAEVVGVAPITLLRWERGTVQPRRDHAIAYRQLLEALSEASR